MKIWSGLLSDQERQVRPAARESRPRVNTTKMSEQRVPFDVREEAKSGLVDWWTGRLDESFLNALCGNTAVSDTKRTGNNSTTAPDSDHIKRKNDKSDDQSLAAADTFTIDLLDSGVERARTLEPGIRPIKQSGGEYFVAFLHPQKGGAVAQASV